jgi:hypothetical protein
MPRLKMGNYKVCRHCKGAITRNEAEVYEGKKFVGFFHNHCSGKKFKFAKVEIKQLINNK